MKNIKAIVGILLVFALGAAGGAVGMYMVQRAKLESFIRGAPEVREEVIVSRLTRRLDLDQQQQAAVRGIVRQNHEAIRRIRSMYHPMIKAVLEQGQTRISALLTPQQQEKFRTMLEERKRRHPEGPPP